MTVGCRPSSAKAAEQTRGVGDASTALPLHPSSWELYRCFPDARSLFSLSLQPTWPLQLSPLTVLPSFRGPFFVSPSLPVPTPWPPLPCTGAGSEGFVLLPWRGWQAEGRHGVPVSLCPPPQHPPTFRGLPWVSVGGCRGREGEVQGGEGAPVKAVGGQRGSPVWS